MVRVSPVTVKVNLGAGYITAVVTRWKWSCIIDKWLFSIDKNATKISDATETYRGAVKDDQVVVVNCRRQGRGLTQEQH